MLILLVTVFAFMMYHCSWTLYPFKNSLPTEVLEWDSFIEILRIAFSTILLEQHVLDVHIVIHFLKNFLQAKCEHYKKKRMEQQETIAALQKDIYRLTQEEEERIITQNRVFSYLCKRVPHTVLDKQ